MKQYLSVLAIAILLVGCSSTGKSGKEVSSSFIGGDLKIIYNKNGEFEAISSTATAKVLSDLPSAKEEAVIVATAKARRQIAEFMRTEVQSDRFISTVSTSLQQSESINQSPDTAESNKIARMVRDNITQRSTAILQGSYVENERYDESLKTIVVIVRAGNKEGAALKGLKKAMSQ
jgi:PBP1b-binding outer membrane lipoprotein LpoB